MAKIQSYTELSSYNRIHYSRNFKWNSNTFSAQRFLGSFEWTSITCDWLMGAWNSIDQSQQALVHPDNPRNHCPKSLYPFTLECLELELF